MDRKVRYAVWFILILGLSFFAGLEDSLPQPAKAGKEPEIRLGSISFKVREIESTPSPLTMLEVQIEVLNRSPQAAAPADSVRVVVTPKEMEYGKPGPAGTLPLRQEFAIPSALPPRTSRIVTVGFQLDKGRLESATFEIQVNPPDGEKKTVSTRF
jgi:hypothetical protein